MINNKKFFVKTHSNASILNTTEVWVDRETGVNYLYLYGGNAGGPTVLVDREGKPIITTVFDEE